MADLIPRAIDYQSQLTARLGDAHGPLLSALRALLAGGR